MSISSLNLYLRIFLCIRRCKQDHLEAEIRQQLLLWLMLRNLIEHVDVFESLKL